MINSNGSLVNSSLDLSKKANTVLFSVKAYTSDSGQIPVKVACNLFNTLVKPIFRSEKELHQFSCSSRTWSTAIRIFYKNSDFSISFQT